jgi:hypothetical protein
MANFLECFGGIQFEEEWITVQPQLEDGQQQSQ